MRMTVFEPTYPVQPSSIGDLIRKARMDAGLQIVQLAKAAGLHEMTIVNWRQGRAIPSADKLEAVKRVLALAP